MGCLWAVRALTSMGCRWAVHGLFVGFPWTVCILSVDCPWVMLPMGYPYTLIKDKFMSIEILQLLETRGFGTLLARSRQGQAYSRLRGEVPRSANIFAYTEIERASFRVSHFERKRGPQYSDIYA